jgi:hypothetical protein
LSRTTRPHGRNQNPTAAAVRPRWGARSGYSPFASTSPPRFGNEVTYDWVAGREYRFRLYLASATGREWIATVLDMETGDETTIGRIRLASAPGYNGYGKLIDDSANPRSFLGWLDATLAAREQ